MCKQCEIRAHRRNPNKYFGFEEHRHLKTWGFRYWMYSWGHNKFKFKTSGYIPRYDNESSNRGGDYRGGMRKGNGIAAWFG